MFRRLLDADQYRKLLRDPGKITSIPTLLRRDYYRWALPKNAKISRQFSSSLGEDAIERDWDNLIILDACRFDYFSALDHGARNLTSISSSASESWEFMANNFEGRTLHDTVYVTANPHVSWLSDGIFHDVVNLLRDDWDDSVGTVWPEVVTERAAETSRSYPDKRLIVHYMQPHYPFLGPAGADISMSVPRTLDEPRDGYPVALNPWYQQLLGRRTTPEAIRAAYRENHEIVLPHVRALLDQLRGKSVVTADHANLVGEWLWPFPMPGWGHPHRIRHPSLNTVPWAVYSDGERKQVSSAPPVEIDRLDEEIVADRLKQLGYQE